MIGLLFILLVFLTVLTLLVGGVVLLLRAVTGSYRSPVSHVAAWYSGALFCYLGALYTGTFVNPHDIRGGFWADPYLQMATTFTFFICAVAPLRLPIPLAAHFGVTAFNLLILLVPLGIWSCATF